MIKYKDLTAAMKQEEAAKLFIETYRKSKFVTLLSGPEKLKLLEKAENAPVTVLLEAINYINLRDKQFRHVKSKNEKKEETGNIFALINEIHVLTSNLKQKYNLA